MARRAAEKGKTKKASARQAKKGAAPPRKRKRVKPTILTANQVSYPRQPRPQIRDVDDAMIYSIMGGAKTGDVSRLSLEMVSALSSMSGETANLDYRHGVNIGRKLFRIAGAGKRYSWYGESIPDLVKFIEMAGYGAVTYRMFPFSISIKIHQRTHDIGAKVHTFEAGLISGFMTAANGQLIHVNETECASNGSEYCDFMTSDVRTSENQKASADGMYGALRKGASEYQNIKREYYALATSGISQKHVIGLDDSAFGMGSEIGGRIAAEHKGYGDAIGTVIGVIRAAYPGAVSVKRVSPSNVRVSFDKLSSRKGVIELMRRFIEGVISAAFGVEGFDESINPTKENSYSMTMRIK